MVVGLVAFFDGGWSVHPCKERSLHLGELSLQFGTLHQAVRLLLFEGFVRHVLAKQGTQSRETDRARSRADGDGGVKDADTGICVVGGFDD